MTSPAASVPVWTQAMPVAWRTDLPQSRLRQKTQWEAGSASAPSSLLPPIPSSSLRKKGDIFQGRGRRETNRERIYLRPHPSKYRKMQWEKTCPELPQLLVPPWDAGFQKGERRAQPGAAGADLEEWGCSGAAGLQIICRKGKGAHMGFEDNTRQGKSTSWMKLWGESWELFVFNRGQITLALCILKQWMIGFF